MNSTSQHNLTHWTLFNQTDLYQNIWFFGRSLSIPFDHPSSLLFSSLGSSSSNFTASNQLFLANPQIVLWRFEVVYSFPSARSSSALNFVINQPPSNGSCSLSPSNGTTTTTFQVWCPDWFDQDGIRDYSLYTQSSDPSKRLLIAFSPSSTFTVQLPAGQGSSSSLALLVSIRDTRSCVTEWNLTSIFVQPDSNAIGNLLADLQGSSNTLTSNPLVQLLAGGNQNTVGQVTGSLSQQFNQMNTENLRSAVSSNSPNWDSDEEIEHCLGGVPASSISVSSLGSARSAAVEIPLSFPHLSLSLLLLSRSPFRWINLHWIYSTNNWTVKRQFGNIWLDSPLRFRSPVQTRFSFKPNP